MTQAIAGGLSQRASEQESTQEQVQVLPRLRTNTLHELGAENRGSTEVQPDEDGTVIVDDIDTDLDAWKRTLNAADAIQGKLHLKT